jgi:hypothetical protein
MATIHETLKKIENKIGYTENEENFFPYPTVILVGGDKNLIEGQCKNCKKTIQKGKSYFLYDYENHCFKCGMKKIKAMKDK